MNLLFILVILLGIILNLIVTIIVVQRDDLDKIQKKIQIFIIWIIPYVSSIGIWLFYNSMDNDFNRKKSVGNSGGLDNYTIGGGGD